MLDDGGRRRLWNKSRRRQRTKVLQSLRQKASPIRTDVWRKTGSGGWSRAGLTPVPIRRCVMAVLTLNVIVVLLDLAGDRVRQNRSFNRERLLLAWSRAPKNIKPTIRPQLILNEKTISKLLHAHCSTLQL